jgi:hypothetical protein
MLITDCAGMTIITAALGDGWVRNAFGATISASNAKAEPTVAAMATPASAGTNFDNIAASIPIRRYGRGNRALARHDHRPDWIFVTAQVW